MSLQNAVVAVHNITPPPPCFTVWTTHVETIRSPFVHFTKTQRLEPKISNLDSSDQSTDFYWFNVHSLCFLAQSSLFFLLVFLSSWPWRTDSRSLPWKADVEMCLLLEVCEAFMLPLIWGAVNLWFLRLVTLMTLSSAAEVTLGLPILGWSSWGPFIKAFDGFRNWTWGYIQSSWNFPDWLTFLY